MKTVYWELIKDFWGFIMVPIGGIMMNTWNNHKKSIKEDKVSSDKRLKELEDKHQEMELEIVKRITIREAQAMMERSVDRVLDTVQHLRDDLRAIIRERKE